MDSVTFNDNCALVGINHNTGMKMTDVFVRVAHEKGASFLSQGQLGQCLTVFLVNVYELLLVKTKIEIKTFIIFPPKPKDREHYLKC